MDPQFNSINTLPENEIFYIVFYPDRVYHAQYLNASRSARYRYYVHEVRNKLDITVLKGIVFLDGIKLANFIRIEYRGSRLVELAREKRRFLRDQVLAWVRLAPDQTDLRAESVVPLTYCPWIDAFQAEFWETLETPETHTHDIKVLDQMGAGAPITRIRAFDAALANLDRVTQLELAFRENTLDEPFGYVIGNPQWDNDYHRSYQVPNTQTPSASENTVDVENYFINFRRGWFFDDVSKILPVRYENAMTEPSSPFYKTPPSDNVIEMRWVLQRELGSSIVYFHEVTIPPGTVEGPHRHVGSEELYYIFEGEGVAWMGEGDDPANSQYPLVEVDIFGLGKKKVREIPVKPRSVIYTKSGGMHGIRNPNDKPLRFVAFGYHAS